MTAERAYFLVLGEQEAIRWVLSHQRMAFPRAREPVARQLTQDDQLFLYVTRSAFRNPTRDRGRIVGLAQPASEVEILEPPLVLFGTTFTSGCKLAITHLAERGTGVELAPLIESLRTFPKPHAWSAKMRQALVPIALDDVKRLRSLTLAVARPFSPTVAKTYD